MVAESSNAAKEIDHSLYISLEKEEKELKMAAENSNAAKEIDLSLSLSLEKEGKESTMAQESSNAANKQDKRKLSFSDTNSEADKKTALDLLSPMVEADSAGKNKAPKLDSAALAVQDPPEFLASLRGKIRRRCEPFEKQMTKNDLGGRRGILGRIALDSKNLKDCMNLLLTDEEKDRIRKLYAGIPVTVYDADGNAYSMEFMSWITEKRVAHVLARGQWKHFWQTVLQRLNPNDNDSVAVVVKVWMFRHFQNDSLGFLISARAEGRERSETVLTLGR